MESRRPRGLPALPLPSCRLFDDADRSDTRAKILDAAFRRLATEGYAALSVREIAKDAGVNHALINYHFRTKDQLVIEVLDAANQRLLARQASMYAGRGGLCARSGPRRGASTRTTSASGFVRVQAELWAASLSNPGLREKFLPRLLAWKQLVLGRRARGHRRAARRDGVKLPPPFTRRGHRLLDLGVLARHGVRRPARREGRAGPAPRGARCRADGCWSRSTPRVAQAGRARSQQRPAASRRCSRRPERGPTCPSASTASPARCPSPARCRMPSGSPFDTVQPVQRRLRRTRRREALVRGVGRQRTVDRLCAAVPDRAHPDAQGHGAVPVAALSRAHDGRPRQRPLRSPAGAGRLQLRPLPRRLRGRARCASAIERVALVGISAAAMTVLRLAAEQPQRVTHVVTAGGFADSLPSDETTGAAHADGGRAAAQRLAGYVDWFMRPSSASRIRPSRTRTACTTAGPPTPSG